MSTQQTDLNRRILLIDDNPAIHADFKKILAASTAPSAGLEEAEAALFGDPAQPASPQAATSFEIRSAHQGLEGLGMIWNAQKAGRPYAMAFVDVRMPPGWDGVETIQRVWKVCPELQIVICTAYSDYSWAEVFQKLGHTDNLLVLKKPFDPVEVLQLAHALTAKWNLSRQATERLELLDALVRERTAALEQSSQTLQQAQSKGEEQARLRALGQMAGGIAHDINNALVPIVGFADLLSEEPDLTPAAQKYLQIIKTCAEDAAHTANRLREFSGRRVGEPDSLRLNPLVGQVRDLTRPRWRDAALATGARIAFEMSLDPSVPPLLGQANEIREALTNLVLNAVDAMPQGGTLTLRTAPAPHAFGAGEPVPAALIEVRDTGVGMDEETRRRCLEPFFTTKGERGSGLGLSMVFGVMQSHGGDVEIESEPGRGTTFRLWLPVPAEPVPQAEAAAPAPPSRLNILYIDDEPLVREVVKLMLRRDGHEVEVAEDGRAGLAAYRASQDRGTPYQVVITDLGMPEMDGRAVASALQNGSPAPYVIMLTGWGAQLLEKSDTPAGVDALLAKPPRVEHLRASLAKAAAMTAA